MSPLPLAGEGVGGGGTEDPRPPRIRRGCRNTTGRTRETFGTAPATGWGRAPKPEARLS